MKVLEFDGQPWITTELGAAAGRHSVTYNLPRMGDKDGVRIEDLKLAFLIGDRKKQRITVGGKQDEKRWDELLVKFVDLALRRIHDELPVGEDEDPRAPTQFHFALPAIPDNSIRLEYQALIKRAVLNYQIARPARTGTPPIAPAFFFEPDAVLQYFRLVKKIEHSQPGTDSLPVVLVVDAGASTTNVSLAFLPATTDGARSGLGRKTPLFPISDGCTTGGRWVDAELGRIIRARVGEISAAKDTQDVDQQTIDALIVQQARELKQDQAFAPEGLGRVECQIDLGDAEPVDTWLDRDDLKGVARALWAAEIRPLLDRVSKQAFDRFSANRYQRFLQSAGVTEPRHFLRLTTDVILAGGTSMLPGFEDELRLALKEYGHATADVISVNRVEPENYRFCVAAGLAAPVAIETHEANAPGSTVEPQTELSVVPIVLPGDIYVSFRDATTGEISERRVFAQSHFPHGYVWNDDESPPAEATTGVAFRRPKRRRYDVALFRDGPEPSEERRLMLGAELRPFVSYELPQTFSIRAQYDMRSGEIALEFIGVAAKAPRKVTHSFLSEIHVHRAPPIGSNRHAQAEPASVRIVCVDLGSSKVAAILPTWPLSLQFGEPPTPAFAEADLVVPAEVAVSGTSAPPEQESTTTAGEELSTEVADLEVVTEPSTPAVVIGLMDDLAKPQGEGQAYVEAIVDEADLIDRLRGVVEAHGLRYSPETIWNVYLSLKVRPFVVFAGPPGVGKTALATAFAHAIGCTRRTRTFLRIPVEADWADSQCLLGTEDEPTPLRRLLRDNQESLSAVLLDEFNLARVEHYFAGFLSAMEADGDLSPGADSELQLPIPKGLNASRLLIFATLNMDESTTMLSDKVLDRCTVITVPAGELRDSIPSRIRAPQQEGLRPLTASDWDKYCELDIDLPVPPEVSELWKILNSHGAAGSKGESRSVRQRVSFGFGFRVLRDICAFIRFSEQLEYAEVPAQLALDLQICQRILPRIHGDHALDSLLTELGAFCTKYALKEAAKRIQAMTAELEDQHYTSFWN